MSTLLRLRAGDQHTLGGTGAVVLAERDGDGGVRSSDVIRTGRGDRAHRVTVTAARGTDWPGEAD